MPRHPKREPLSTAALPSGADDWVRNKQPTREERAFQEQCRAQMVYHDDLDPEGWVRSYFTRGFILPPYTDTCALVFDKLIANSWKRRGEWVKSDGIDPDRVQAILIEGWGAGRYRFQPKWNGRLFAPVSRHFDIGDDPVEREAGKDRDTDLLETEVLKTVRREGIMRQASILGIIKPREGGEDVPAFDMQGLAAVLQAVKPAGGAGPDPLVIELIREIRESNRQLAEQNKAILEELKNRARPSPDMLTGLLGALGKTRNPDLIARVMGVSEPAEAPTDWMAVIKELLPMAKDLLGSIVVQRVVPNAGQSIPMRPAPNGQGYAPGFPPQAPIPTPAPQPPESVIPLNRAQRMAIDQIVACVNAGDYASGLSGLQMFPISDPLPQAPMGVSLGEIFLNQLDQLGPTGNPDMAVPFLLRVAPALDPAHALEWVKWMQREAYESDTHPEDRGPVDADDERGRQR